MNTCVKLLIALTLSSLSWLAQAADPVVDGRAQLAEAKKTQKQAFDAAGKAYAEAKAKAKAELAAEKAENSAKAKAETAAGRDGLIMKRRLDNDSNLSYKNKLKAAKEARKAAEKEATAAAAPAKAAAKKQMQQGLKPDASASAAKP